MSQEMDESVFEDLLVEALYDGLDDERRAEFERLLETRPDFAETYAAMRATLETVNRRERRDPGQAYWDGYFNRLRARMEREGQRRGLLDRFFPRWSASSLRWASRGVLAALLIVFGAVVGRMVIPGTQVPEAPPVTAGKGGEQEPTAAEEMAVTRPVPEVPKREKKAGRPTGDETRLASTNACAREYLEDSRVLLLALVNFDPEKEGPYVADLARKRSGELVAEASSLKGDLTDPSQRRLRNLVTELELILIQIANLETENDEDAVELIRTSVDRQDLMLKINMERMKDTGETRCSTHEG